ncbi:ribonuclease H-like domain-containing protein [Clostridiaceae bacterium 35-E11]
MEIIQHQLKQGLQFPKKFISLYENIHYAIFDIETTGLNPNLNHVILIGILYIKNNQVIIEQFFCNHRSEEKDLLTSFKQKIEAFDLLVNYNGNTFDIPFLNQRFSKHGINYSIGSYKSFDLLKLVRRVKKELNLENYKLKSIEEYLGIQRTDMISGKDSVALYNQFEKTKNTQQKEIILLHNFDDLYYLGKSLNILDNISYENIINASPQIFHVKKDENIYIANAIIKHGTLEVEGIYKTDSTNSCIIHERGFSFHYDQSTFKFSIRIPLYKGNLSSGKVCLYINAGDFPFSYVKKEIPSSIPQNILLLKEGRAVKTTEMYSFIKKLISCIINTLTS